MSGAILLTGASGFVGRRIVRELAAIGRPIFAMVRAPERLPAELREPNVTAVAGDLGSQRLGLSPVDRELLKSNVTDVIHAGALREPRSEEEGTEVNVRGTERLVALALDLPRLRRFVHISSISVAGDYPGRFYEDWLDVGQSFPSVYARCKYAAEQHVRATSELPSVIVRPGAIVGDSVTGQSDSSASTLDRLAAALLRLRKLPRALPLPRPFPPKRMFPVVPVDYVARAILGLSLLPAPRAMTYCLIDPNPPRLEAVTNHLSDRIGAPRMRWQVPLGPLLALTHVPGIRAALERVHFPVSSLAYLDCSLDFDDHNARKALEPSGLRCPPFFSYADTLVDAFLAAV